MTRQRTRTGGAVQAGAGKFGEPATQAAKHLCDCRVLVIHQNEETNRYWAERTAEGLQPHSKEAAAWDCGAREDFYRGSVEGTITRAAEAAKGKDIVIVMFYRHQEDSVHSLIKGLRQAHPSLYVVIASATPGIAPGGKADLVVNKTRVLEEGWFKNELGRMLSNPALGPK